MDTITSFLGGRVAEELVFNEVTTGAHNDFQNATKIARAMVTEYGMSKLGPVQYEQQQGSVFLGRDYLKDKNFSDQIAHEIDKETRNIIEECYEKARICISENMDLLNNIADYLLKVETLNKSDIDEITSTGHLNWYDTKKALKLAEEQAQKQETEVKTETEIPSEPIFPEEINTETKGE
jgi:cell division protease FtsH